MLGEPHAAAHGFGDEAEHEVNDRHDLSKIVRRGDYREIRAHRRELLWWRWDPHPRLDFLHEIHLDARILDEAIAELKAEREVQLRVVERRRQEDGSVASLQCENDSGCGEEPVRLRRGPGAM